MAAISTLHQDYTHYKRCYEVFEKKSGKIQLYNQWANDKFPSIIKNTFEKGTQSSCFCSMGVGSGSGDFESTLLEQLLHHFPSIHHTVVEPMEEFVSHYKRHSILDNVQYDWQLKTIQEYMHDHKSVPIDRKFDFISAVNSLYYVDDLQETLRFLLKQLTQKGSLMIVIRAEKGTGYRLLENFPEVRFEGNHLLSSLTIVDMMQAMGLNTTTYHLPTVFDLSSVFNPKDKDGDALLDMFTGAVDFRRTAPKELLEAVLTFLYEEKHSEVIDSREYYSGQVAFMDWNIIIVRQK